MKFNIIVVVWVCFPHLLGKRRIAKRHSNSTTYNWILLRYRHISVLFHAWTCTFYVINLLAKFCMHTNLVGRLPLLNTSLCASYFYSKCIIKEAYFCVIHNIPKTKKWGKTNRKGARSRKQAIKQQNQRRKKKLICCCLRILWLIVKIEKIMI